jgi:alanyl-tRNA synthetase
MISPEELASVEAMANEAVWRNLPLKCWYPSREELPDVVYRSKRPLDWPVRIVQVPGFDSCACCGVHTAMTGEVGIIKIVSWMKFHQGIRLQMVCGNRAYRYLTAVLEQNRLVSQTFSAKMLETADAAGKMAEALAAEKFRSNGLEKRIFDTLARQYEGQGFVLHFEENLTGGSLRDLADKIAQVCHGTAAVFSGNDKNGYNYCLASRTENLSGLNKQMTQALQGRGGGKPNFQQGSVKATNREIVDFFQKNNG